VKEQVFGCSGVQVFGPTRTARLCRPEHLNT
jgi:hypothetical protein